jgi:hypothetical protein
VTHLVLLSCVARNEAYLASHLFEFMRPSLVSYSEDLTVGNRARVDAHSINARRRCGKLRLDDSDDCKLDRGHSSFGIYLGR